MEKSPAVPQAAQIKALEATARELRLRMWQALCYPASCTYCSNVCIAETWQAFLFSVILCLQAAFVNHIRQQCLKCNCFLGGRKSSQRHLLKQCILPHQNIPHEGLYPKSFLLNCTDCVVCGSGRYSAMDPLNTPCYWSDLFRGGAALILTSRSKTREGNETFA